MNVGNWNQYFFGGIVSDYIRTVIKNHKTENKGVELMSFCMLLIILTKNLQFRESINYNQANSVSEHDESNFYVRIEAQRQMLHQKIRTLWTSTKHGNLRTYLHTSK